MITFRSVLVLFTCIAFSSCGLQETVEAAKKVNADLIKTYGHKDKANSSLCSSLKSLMSTRNPRHSMPVSGVNPDRIQDPSPYLHGYCS